MMSAKGQNDRVVFSEGNYEKTTKKLTSPLDKILNYNNLKDSVLNNKK